MQCVSRPDQGDNRKKIERVKQYIREGDRNAKRLVALFGLPKQTAGGSAIDETDTVVDLYLHEKDEGVNALAERFQAAAAVSTSCDCGLKKNDGRTNKCLSGNWSCKKAKQACTEACFCKGLDRCKLNN